MANIELFFKEIVTENGLFCQFDEKHGILFLDVKNSFSSEDFVAISSLIDPYFEEFGQLSGVIVNSKKFPYWQNIHNRAQYFHFAQQNHNKFKKVAFLMGGFFIKIVVRVARGKVSSEVKLFKYNRISEAQNWILSDHGFLVLD